MVLTKTAGKLANPPLPAKTPNASGPTLDPIKPNPIVSDITEDFNDGGTLAETIDNTLGVTGLQRNEEK